MRFNEDKIRSSRRVLLAVTAANWPISEPRRRAPLSTSYHQLPDNGNGPIAGDGCRRVTHLGLIYLGIFSSFIFPNELLMFR